MATATVTLSSSSRSKSWGLCCTVSAVAVSVPLDVEGAVAVVYGVVLFVSPINCRRIVLYTYTDCSRVVK